MLGIGKKVPGAKQLQEASDIIQLFELISTAKGLKEAMEELKDERNEIDAILAENSKLAKENEETLKGIEQAIKESEDKSKKAFDDIENAKIAKEQAKEKLDQVVAAQKTLDSSRTAFEEDQRIQKNHFNDLEISLRSREEKALKTLEKGEALKAEYEEKLADLKKITG